MGPYRLLFLLGVFFFTFMRTSYGQERNSRDNLEDSDLDHHVETAITAFFGVLFVENHDLTNFRDTRDEDRRILPLDLMSKSKNERVRQVIGEAVDSASVSWVIPKKLSLVSFFVPGGLFYYLCHTDSFLYQADKDHCTACEGPDGVSSVQLTKEKVVHLTEICPNPL